MSAPIVVVETNDEIRIERPKGMTDEVWAAVRETYNARWRAALAAVVTNVQQVSGRVSAGITP